MPKNTKLATLLEHNIPYLRRYARALTGSQASGDNQVAATLEALTADRSMFDETLEPRIALFKCFHSVWVSADPETRAMPDGTGTSAMETRAQARLARLTPNGREAVLLKMLEGLDIEEISQALDQPESEARSLVETGMQEMRSAVVSKVLIIEDEPIIAMDIELIVSEMGHQVTGIARTETEASSLSRTTEFDIVLADINLADGSSGIDAVRYISATRAICRSSSSPPIPKDC